MKSIVMTLILAGSVFLLQGCLFGDDGSFGCLRGDGDVRTEEFFLQDITGVKLNGIGDVIIRRGDTQKIIVETDKNLMNRVQTSVRGGVWDIDFERCVRRVTQFTVYITVPEMRRLVVSGSGSIVGQDTFEGSSLEASISGSGNIDFLFEGGSVEMTISGSGAIDMGGTAENSDIRISGSGNIRAFDLITAECNAFISGSGNARVYVEDYLKVRISGSGDVLYKGNPVLDVDISGSGSVINRN